MLKIDAANLLFTVINLLVLFVAMKLVFFKPIAKIIAERQAEADRQFEDAAVKQAEADSLKEQYDASIADIEEQKKKTLLEARKNADAEYQKIVATAQDQAKQIKSDAQEEAYREKEKILKSAEKEITDMVVDAAAKMVGTQSGAELNSALYNEFLGKAGD